MFTGYLNLQLGMFRQATGDQRFSSAESLVFEWSRRQRFAYDHQSINAIAVRNFDQDLCLWPCEPVLGPGRTRGYVFPYCNAVTTAGVAIMDKFDGMAHAAEIARRSRPVLEREFTDRDGELVAFMISGIGMSVRSRLSGPTMTAAALGLTAPLFPDLAMRAWDVLRHEWLESARFEVPGSAGEVIPDWSSNAKTNAESLAAAMMLADACGDRSGMSDCGTRRASSFGSGRQLAPRVSSVSPTPPSTATACWASLPLAGPERSPTCSPCRVRAPGIRGRGCSMYRTRMSLLRRRFRTAQL